MKILCQNKNANEYFGTLGTPTNMYDYRGNQLFVGDVVCEVTYGVDNKKNDDFGINFVCEENTKITNWTNRDMQYVDGLANIYNNKNFEVLDEFEFDSDEWWGKLYDLDPDFRVFKVKDYSELVTGERIGYLSVIDVEEMKENAEK